MASVTTPTIKKIVRLNNYDLLGTKCNKYMMYMCLDTLQLWYDESDSKRTLYGYVGVDTVNDLQNNLIPELGVTYYCWESNSLWLWMNRWICIYTDGNYPSAYRTDNNYIEEIYLSDDNPTIVDNNGLLRDGSVVIRDPNRIIKGRMYISDKYDNLVISSYLGGGIRILPNGSFSTDGELLIDDDAKSHIRGEWNVLNHEIYVDYSEKPTTDPSKYKSDINRYKVWHEGNLKLEDLTLDGKGIIDKIKEAQSKKELSDPLDLNVDRVDGMHATDFALKTHVHSSSDISDFKQAAQDNANQAMMDKLTNMIFKGAKITWVEASQKYQLSTDNFILAFTGGATGQGTVTNNTNTTIALTIDPTKHTHSDLVTRIAKLEEGGGTDLSNYYTKNQTDAQIASWFTSSPVQNKALLVDANKNIPANALTASDLDHDTVFTLQGDITGSVTFGYDKTQLSMTTNASAILSDIPTAGKALKIDSNGDIPTRAYSAKELDHTIKVQLQGDITGSATLDTASDSIRITTTLSENADVLRSADIGTKVASLDDGIVPSTQLPAGIMDALKLVGTWQGTTAPVSTPAEGQAWLVTGDCTYNSKKYKKGDWIYYYNSSWNKADIATCVKSVNGITGEDIVLDASAFDAIPRSYIDYTPGTTIPEGKVVVTDDNGHIAGATVDNLTDAFSVKTTGGDVSISKSSPKSSTDGSQDLELRLELTSDGYDNIKSEVARAISVNDTDYPFTKNINFNGSITTEVVGDFLNLNFDSANGDIFFSGTATTEFLNNLNTKFAARESQPFSVVFSNSGVMHSVHINAETPNLQGGSIDIQSDECIVNTSGNTLQVQTSKATITFGTTGNITGFKITTSTLNHPTLLTSGGDITGNITPTTNNTLSLGTSAKKFANMYATTFNGDLSGNAATSTKLKAPVKINNVAFDGSSDITIDIGSTDGGVYKLAQIDTMQTKVGLEVTLADSINNYDYLIVAVGAVSTRNYTHHICMPYSGQYTSNKRTRAKWRIGTDYLALNFLDVEDLLGVSYTACTLVFSIESETSLKMVSNSGYSLESQKEIEDCVRVRGIYGVKLF